MVYVKVNFLMETRTWHNIKMAKGKAMEHITLPSLVVPTLASLKTMKNTAMATASGKMEDFITDNGRKEREKDMDSIDGQAETSMTENGKTMTNQEKESSNGRKQAQSKK